MIKSYQKTVLIVKLFILVIMPLHAQESQNSFLVTDYTTLNCFDQDSTQFCAIGSNDSFINAVVIALDGILLQCYYENRQVSKERGFKKKIKKKEIREDYERITLNMENLKYELYRKSKYTKFGKIESSFTGQLSYMKGNINFLSTRSYKVINTEFYWDKTFSENKHFSNFIPQDFTENLIEKGFEIQAALNEKNNTLEIYVLLTISKEKILEYITFNQKN